MNNNLRDELADLRHILIRVVQRLGKVDNHLDGRPHSPPKPLRRREFNDNMLQLLHDRGLLPGSRVPKEIAYFSLNQVIDLLLSENSSPAAAASGPPKAKPASRASKATSSNAGKPARRGKGGK